MGRKAKERRLKNSGVDVAGLSMADLVNKLETSRATSKKFLKQRDAARGDAGDQRKRADRLERELRFSGNRILSLSEKLESMRHVNEVLKSNNELIMERAKGCFFSRWCPARKVGE
jgi:hypothetical protein